MRVIRERKKKKSITTILGSSFLLCLVETLKLARTHTAEDSLCCTHFYSNDFLLFNSGRKKQFTKNTLMKKNGQN